MTRPQADTVGFASSEEAMNGFLERVAFLQGEELAAARARIPAGTRWRAAIVPHDDYAYVGHLYPAITANLTAPNVILFGVAHKARSLGLEDRIVLDSYERWESATGSVAVSDLREVITHGMSRSGWEVHHELQATEHSLEAIVPFLERSAPGRRILPILIPAMSFDRIEQIGTELAGLLIDELVRRGWELGRDVAIAISSDAVHYGDTDWQGNNFARYGTDAEGTRRAVDHELALIEECFAGPIDLDRLRRFVRYTVRSDDFREYNWTWCGRYSIPFGLFVADRLRQGMGQPPLDGLLVGYGTSIDGRERIPVEDLGMGLTAPANARHWVGYASIGFV